MFKEWFFWKRDLKASIALLDNNIKSMFSYFDSLNATIQAELKEISATIENLDERCQALQQDINTAESTAHANKEVMDASLHKSFSEVQMILNNILNRQNTFFDFAKVQNEYFTVLVDKVEKLEFNDKNAVDGVMTKLEAMHYWPNQNLKKRLYDLAGNSAARFIIEHMEKIPSFLNSKELLCYSLSLVSNKEGLYAEFGVYSGSSINYIAKQVPDTVVYGFDSFEGLPETWRTDFEKGMFKVDQLPTVESNVCLIKGYFEDVLPDYSRKYPQSFSFMHVDCDLYSSTKSIFKILAPQISSGCVIVFDEFFNYPGWEKGESKAFFEFIEESGKNFEFIGYVETHEQAAVIIK